MADFISIKCVNCHEHFQPLRELIKEVKITHHFQKDAPNFDINSILDIKHIHFQKLHKFEENIQGNHIFRALDKKKHIVYAVDKNYRLVFLRAFDSFNEYKKFLDNKKKIIEMINSV